nr:MAG TPA: hypothetical protein [Caudoviricetes sp.]
MLSSFTNFFTNVFMLYLSFLCYFSCLWFNITLFSLKCQVYFSTFQFIFHLAKFIPILYSRYK